MADQKITALTADTSPSADDLFITVNDPGGTPANRKVTFASMEAAMAIANMSDVSDFATLATLASTSNGDGAALIGIEDAGGLITATTVEGALAENRAAIDAIEAAGYITATLTQEQVEDYVGAMFSGNTETLITATYQDADGTIDLVVDNDLANYSNANSGFAVASDLASTATSAGASLIGIEDAGALITATTVEGALAENRAAIDALEAAGYITDVSGDNLSALADVTITTIASGEVLKWAGAGWVNNTLAEAGIAAASHTHAASDITSGTLAHERGGLEADVSAYAGLVKISGGVTSAVTDNSSNWDTAFGWGDHASGGYVADTTQVIAGDGLSDGGALSGNVTLNVDIFGQTENASPASGDVVLVENSAGGTFRKVQLGNLPGSGANLSGLGDVTITGPASGDLLRYNGSAWVDQSLAEIDLPTLTNLASTSNALGASLIGIEDAGTLITATTVEGALAENRAAIDTLESNNTGTNTGDQTITLTGDVTGSGTGSFATTIAAGAVDVAMLANGTDGELITWDATGAPATVAVGTSGQVLTSNGVGAAPTFQDATGGGLADVVDDTTPQLGGDLDTNGSNIVAGNGDGLLTGTTAGNTLLLGAYDVDGVAYKTFATLTANNTPTMNLDTAVTIDSDYIVRVNPSPSDNEVATFNGTTGLVDGNAGFTYSATSRLYARTFTGSTNTVDLPLRVSAITSGSVAAGYGAGVDMYAENASGNEVQIGTLEWAWTTATDAAEVSDLVGYVYEGGAKTEAFRADTSANQFNLPTGWAFAVNGTPIGGGGLSNVVEDTTPQLGGQLDVNGNALGDGTLELLSFTETASAVNQINVTNNSTGNAPILGVAGDDTNIDLVLAGKGTGVPKIGSAAILVSGGDLGTPSAGVATNLTGTASGLTAGAVSTITGLAPDTATTQATQPNITSAANLATVGTVTTGTWNATAVAAQYGGTGLNTSASTGIAQVSSGTWSVSTSLPAATTHNGTTIKKVGAETIWVPATAMTARTTSGAASGSAESTTNKVMIETFDFDAATDEFVQFSVAFPKSWNGGTVQMKFFWSNASGTGNVVWAAQAMALADDDALDTAFGTAQTVTDGVTAAGDLMVSGNLGTALTIAGTPGDDEMVTFQVYRDADNGSDTLAGDARLHGVKIIYTTDAANDD